MATNSPQKRLEQLEEEEEEEEEALSLCDLPVNLINDEDQSRKPDSEVIETQEEFDFRSWGGPFSKESEMCAADEVFFQGQILPLHLSLTTTSFQRDGQQFNRCESTRSKSLDHGSLTLSEFRSNSSRSSSLRSQNSSSSSSYSTTTTTPRVPKPRVQEYQFHMHSSPKPQLRAATIPREASFDNQGRKSSAWEFFRLGVVPAPEIGLQDLKVRSTNNADKNYVSRNSSSSSSNVNGLNNANSATKSVKMSYDANNSGKRNHIFKQVVGKGGGSWSWSGCKCSVETLQSDIIIIRSGTHKTESTTHAVKEKVLELKRQKNRQKEGKQTLSRHRTLEWIKELSHASYPDGEALLSNS